MAPKDSDDAVPIAGESSDPKKDKDGDVDDKATAKKKGATKKLSDGDPTAAAKEDAMSEEDRDLKERLETCVSTLVNEGGETAVTIPIRLAALDVIVNELRTATSSMTSVPKPLKFLRPRFGTLKALYATLEDGKDGATTAMTADRDSLEFRARLADVLAVLAMTMGNPGEWSGRGGGGGPHFIIRRLRYEFGLFRFVRLGWI
jgi:RPN1 N-terminal domain